jgi:hypothetical protein
MDDFLCLVARRVCDSGRKLWALSLWTLYGLVEYAPSAGNTDICVGSGAMWVIYSAAKKWRRALEKSSWHCSTTTELG